jgi:hypothetical protein
MKLLDVLSFWRRRKSHEREWYRRQEESIREGIGSEQATQGANNGEPEAAVASKKKQ